MRKYLLVAMIIFSACVRCFGQTSFQTRTATLFNYNLAGSLVTNFDRKSDVGDVQFDDNVYASTKKMAARNHYSLLTLQGFGFNIPSNATIQGITVKVRRFKTGNGDAKESFTSLIRNRENPNLPPWWETYGVRWQDPNPFPSVETEVNYSQSGTGTFNGQTYEWTPERVNHSFFGVALQTTSVEAAMGTVVVNYDFVEITVGFSQPPINVRRSSEIPEVRGMKEPIVYPNPFATKTNIQFTASESGNAIVELFNINGVKVRTLFSGSVLRGQVYNVAAGDVLLPKGIYVYNIKNGKQNQRGQLIKLQ